MVDALATGTGTASATVVSTPTRAGVVSRNRAGGRSRLGSGIARWDPPVVAPPTGAGPDLDHHFITAQAFGAVTTTHLTQPTYKTSRATAAQLRDRLVVGGRDVTYYRGVPTPFPGFNLVQPLMYGPTAITFPQVAAALERPGIGVLSWCRVGAPVRIERVDPDTGTVVAVDYRGVVIGYDAQGASLTLQVGGEAEGRASLLQQQVPVFVTKLDIGQVVWRSILDLGLRFTPRLGPSTGIAMYRSGGQGKLEHLREVLAKAWTRDGNQWTVMPNANGAYTMFRKDTTTVHGIAYCNDARTVANLSRDASEEPNRVYVTGITPDGQRVRFAVFPGLRQTNPPPYPMAGGATFGQGTSDAQTQNGDGITVMLYRLVVTKYLDLVDVPGGYDLGVTRAIRQLQRDADLPVTGNVNPATWNALYDLSTTGYSLRWARVLPAAEDPRVRRWSRSPSGAIMGRNPAYDSTVLPVEVNYDMGTGFTVPQLKEYARTKLEQSAEDNWTGTITFHTGALLQGDFNMAGDPPPVTPADLLDARDLRPGMNLYLPKFDGGITVHIAAISVGADGKVTATVDTRARDAMEVWEVIERNRSTRNSPSRDRRRAARGSTQVKDQVNVWDNAGGILADNVELPTGTWVVIPIPAADTGTVRALRLRVTPAAEFSCAVFGSRIYPSKLKALIGDPLTKAGWKRWSNESVRATLTRDHRLLYVAGSDKEPLGYYPKRKTSESDTSSTASTALLTGRYEDEASFPYYTSFDEPLLYLAVWAARATTLRRGRVMEASIEAGV